MWVKLSRCLRLLRLQRRPGMVVASEAPPAPHRRRNPNQLVRVLRRHERRMLGPVVPVPPRGALGVCRPGGAPSRRGIRLKSGPQRVSAPVALAE
jgi:hypothetical protein